MRFDFICSSLAGGGAERVMVLLANYFVTKNHDVTIITFNEREAFHVDDAVKRVRLHSRNIKNHTLRSIVSLVSHYRTQRNRPDIAISFLCRMNFISIIACKIFSIKIIASEHNNHLRRNDTITQFTWNYLYRCANAITVLTKFDKPFFENKGANVVVMPNPSAFIPIRDILVKGGKSILAVGNYNRYHAKGFDNLIKLISPILKKYPDWVLKIVGKGDRGLPILKDLVVKHGMEQQIIFTGFRNDVNSMMRESDIFILPSRFEGLPMVLLEAMSQGMACIAYDCITGPSEMIVHNQNGLLIKDQDMDAMKEGLIKLIVDEGLRKELALSAVKSLDRFSIENVYRQWENLFQEIV